MARKTAALLFIAGLTCALSVARSTEASKPSPPPPPPPTVPDMRETNPTVICVDCGEPFDAETHQKILEKLLNNPYIAELRKVSYFQDIVHQFESKAHFDNCDFESTMDYITSLLEDTKTQIEAAQLAKASGNVQAMEAAAKRAFFALGQVLHAVQDFYAHSNYVELQTPKVTKVTDIKIVEPWRQEGRDSIKQAQQAGLISGVVFWGFPQKCPSGTMSHADLAKDSADTKSGKKLVTNFQNLSQYRIAVFLAREASTNLIRDAFQRWPLLKEVNGENVAFEILIDRRGL